MECNLFSALGPSKQPLGGASPCILYSKNRRHFGSAVTKEKTLVYFSEASDCNRGGGCQAPQGCALSRTQIRLPLKFGVCWVLIVTLLLF